MQIRKAPGTCLVRRPCAERQRWPWTGEHRKYTIRSTLRNMLTMCGYEPITAATRLAMSGLRLLRRIKSTKFIQNVGKDIFCFFHSFIGSFCLNRLNVNPKVVLCEPQPTIVSGCFEYFGEFKYFKLTFPEQPVFSWIASVGDLRLTYLHLMHFWTTRPKCCTWFGSTSLSWYLGFAFILVLLDSFLGLIICWGFSEILPVHRVSCTPVCLQIKALEINPACRWVFCHLPDRCSIRHKVPFRKIMKK